MSKFKPFYEFQKPLVGLSPESFLDYINTVIPEDHLCRLVRQVVFSLDTELIESKYSFLGQNTYHPKLLLGLLFYGYATGVRRSRKLEERCISDHIYIYLMQCYRPDHRTISDFRKNNLEEIERYFVEIVRIFNKLGFARVGKIYIDGAKIKGNASAKRTKDQAGFEKWLSNIREEITDLMKEVEAIDKEEDERYKAEAAQELLKKRLSGREYLKEKIEDALKEMKKEDRKKINLTDSEAKHMKAGGSKDIRPGYNCQAAATEEGVIVAVDAVTEANDHGQLEPMIEQTESNTGEKVDEASADSGYGGYASCEYLEKRGI
ncbi:MAG: transposase, partial [Candidatus Scalinduaceae bacterium]